MITQIVGATTASGTVQHNRRSSATPGEDWAVGQQDADKVTLSSTTPGATDYWRTAPIDYPRGFPESAKEAIDEIRSDPSVSFREYAILLFEVTHLPQVESGIRLYGKPAQGETLPLDTDVFTRGDFSFSRFVESLIERKEEQVRKGEYVELNTKLANLLRRFEDSLAA